MNKKVKTPDQLFEERRLESLKELERQKLKEEKARVQTLLLKKLKSPKDVFGESHIIPIESIEEEPEVIEEPPDPIQVLEERVDSLPKPKYYDEDIKLLRKQIRQVRDSIPAVKEFDSSDLYEKINLLKDFIDDVRNQIPEQILYDDQLNQLQESIESVRKSIPEVPEVKYYDDDLEDLNNFIEEVRNEIPIVPEIRYYDDQIKNLEEWIKSLPQPKYYDKDIEELTEEIENVRSEIPTIPKIKYYDEEINQLSEDINTIKSDILDLPEPKYYDADIEKLNENIELVRLEIPTIPQIKYYDEDLAEVKSLIESVRSEIPTVPEIKYYDEDLKNLSENIEIVKSSIPTVPDYDEDITKLSIDINDLKNRLIQLKLDENTSSKNLKVLEDNNKKIFDKISYLEETLIGLNEQVQLDEQIINEPPETKNEDPLTPLTQNFVTFKQLQDHYRTFIARIQQQLSTIGGGGETQLKYLDDVVGVATNPSQYDGKYLKYNHSIRKFEFSPVELKVKNLEDIVGIATNPEAYDGKYLKYNHSSGVFEFATIVGEDGEFSGALKNLFDVDNSNLNNGSMMIYNQNIDKFVFVDPAFYFGINNDFNPDPQVDDYGSY
jgi:pyruvate-formate lyase-activating enzyme